MRFLFEIPMVPLGIFGVYLGRGDMASGSQLLGVAQAAGGVILAVWAIRAAVGRRQAESRAEDSPVHSRRVIMGGQASGAKYQR